MISANFPKFIYVATLTPTKESIITSEQEDYNTITAMLIAKNLIMEDCNIKIKLFKQTKSDYTKYKQICTLEVVGEGITFYEPTTKSRITLTDDGKYYVVTTNGEVTKTGTMPPSCEI